MKFGTVSPVLRLLLFAIVFALVSCGGGESEDATAVSGSKPADLLLLNGYVYTADAQRSVVEAVAVNDGLISAVGSSADMQSLQGPETRVIDLAGRMMLPGLHDSHIHIFGIVEPDTCSLRSKPMSLEEMVPYLQECIQHYQLACRRLAVCGNVEFCRGQPGFQRGCLPCAPRSMRCRPSTRSFCGATTAIMARSTAARWSGQPMPRVMSSV